MTKHLALLLVVAASTVSCKKIGSSDVELKTVQIEQSPIKNQGQANHCWAYAFSSMLEAEARRRGDKDIILSPEHLVFYKIFDLVLKNTYYEPDMMSRFAFDGGGMNLASELAMKYGMVPSKVFDQKMEYQQPTLQERVQTWIKQTLTDQSKVTYFNQHPDELRAELSKALDVKTLGPNTEFEFDGQTYTPLSFARDRLKYDASLYQNVTINQENLVQVLAAIKASLMAGHTVPIALMMLSGDLPQADFNSFDTRACTREHPCQISYGHQVLLVDFETEQTAFGPMPADAVARSANLPITRLLAKNSWGTQWGVNKSGKLDGIQENNGYFYVSPDLLNPPADAMDPEMRKFFSVNVYLLKSIWQQQTANN